MNYYPNADAIIKGNIPSSLTLKLRLMLAIPSNYSKRSILLLIIISTISDYKPVNKYVYIPLD